MFASLTPVPLAVFAREQFLKEASSWRWLKRKMQQSGYCLRRHGLLVMVLAIIVGIVYGQQQPQGASSASASNNPSASVQV